MTRAMLVRRCSPALYQWQDAVLVELETPVDVDGNPWPKDAEGKLIGA